MVRLHGNGTDGPLADWTVVRMVAAARHEYEEIKRRKGVRVICCQQCRQLPFAVQRETATAGWKTVQFYPRQHEAMDGYRRTK